MEFELITDQDTWFSQSRALRAAKEERDAIVGDVVHLWLGGSCHAAIVRRDDLDTVSLVAFPIEGDLPPAYRDGIRHSEEKVYDTWHWPCGGQ
jgi:hypothetical protein